MGDQISTPIQYNCSQSLSEKEDTNTEMEKKIERTQCCWFEIEGIGMNSRISIYVDIEMKETEREICMCVHIVRCSLVLPSETLWEQ